ncbi:GIY-YIG nuclease family protein [Stetteria hydrogenophila]
MLEGIPARRGCYVLVVEASGSVWVGARRFRGTLPPGVYLYVGSAGGPGGLRARIQRHARRGKRLWWHVDWLTSSPNARLSMVAYCAAPSWGRVGPPCESEASRCLAARGYEPVEGFGASDDPESPSHLYTAPPGVAPERIARDALECLQKSVGWGAECGVVTLPRGE